MTEDECNSRLAGILEGPWSESQRARRSVKYLKPPISLDLGATKIDLRNVRASDAREQELQQLLAPHWIRPIPQDETWLRLGLDEALTAPMLLELAIECGYIDESSTRRHARQLLAPILWSQAVQTYIIDYEYVSVLLLALRAEMCIKHVEHLNLPPLDADGSAEFSTFLAYFRLFFEDRNIWHFLRLLDDYTSRKTRKKMLWRALAKGTDVTDAIVDASEGAIRFLEHLAAVDRLATDAMRTPFALFYSYWLAKFFGYELAKDGYRESRKRYNWSTHIPALARLAQTKLHEQDGDVFVLGARRLWESARSASREYANALSW